MKNLILLASFLISLLSNTTVQAQSFAPVGAYWCYTGMSSLYQTEETSMKFWTDTVRCEKDTIVDGMNCRKLSVYRRELHINNPDTFFATADYYLYDNTDTVFVYSPSLQQFVPLYIFSAQPGDTICLPVPFPEFANNILNYCFIVDTVQTMNFEGIPLKTIHTRTLLESSDTASVGFGKYGYIQGMYTEKLGGSTYMLSGLFPTVTYHNDPATGHPKKEPGLPGGWLSHYSDAQHAMVLSSSNCDLIMQYVTNIASSEKSDFVKIYPNPTTETVFIEFGTPFSYETSVQIVDNLGKSIRVLNIPSGQNRATFNLENIAPGIYYIKIKTVEGQLYYHRLAIVK